MSCRGPKRFARLCIGFWLVLLACNGCETPQGQVPGPADFAPREQKSVSEFRLRDADIKQVAADDKKPAENNAKPATDKPADPGQPPPATGADVGPDCDASQGNIQAALRGGHKDKRHPDLPHELSEVSLPTYVIEPPDILQLDAVRLVPKTPYLVKPLDVLGIQVTGTLPNAPIQGLYQIDTDGTLALGFTYGSPTVEGLSIKDVKKVLDELLKPKLKDYEITVVLAESRTLQQIRGPHLVRPDGTIGLGTYGSVYVDGMTIAEARAAIEQYLSAYVEKPEISVDVQGFNSKVYYVITDGGGLGVQVARLPVTGKLTILDALSGNGSSFNPISVASSKQLIYLVRPTPKGKHGEEEVYRIDWNGIASRGRTSTNYQIMPGDRVYVAAAPLFTFNNYLTRVLAPFEQALGVVGLGNSTVRQFLVPIPTNVNGVLTTPGF